MDAHVHVVTFLPVGRAASTCAVATGGARGQAGAMAPLQHNCKLFYIIDNLIIYIRKI
jgi:hypothetical protein